mmetsp:Transcript_2693/g.9438  ORF Transcript_2693/g.9438 Transcript_2693/m.9438 type:complete len:205 (-) Transcript_2693:372-986(-)
MVAAAEDGGGGGRWERRCGQDGCRWGDEHGAGCSGVLVVGLVGAPPPSPPPHDGPQGRVRADPRRRRGCSAEWRRPQPRSSRPRRFAGAARLALRAREPHPDPVARLGPRCPRHRQPGSRRRQPRERRCRRRRRRRRSPREADASRLGSAGAAPRGAARARRRAHGARHRDGRHAPRRARSAAGPAAAAARHAAVRGARGGRGA